MICAKDFLEKFGFGLNCLDERLAREETQVCTYIHT